ncbi:MAG: efflux RND transporter periplasmic adaptor subunit [Calditrichaeota bacterium]|nr:MAG: efflux RND transporter periplasmic adaptor subunit [Calditrichota bacterium]
MDAGATSLRELQEAREALTRAEVAYRFARARLQLLNHPQAALDSAKLPEVEVRAPFDGVVQQVGTSPGSQISDGAPLLSFVQTNPLWVEVPLLPEEVAQLDLARGALVYELSPAKGVKARIARFVRRQPGADARTLQTRLYFQLDNPDNRFLPGQKVRATLFYPRQAQQLVIPAAALTIDMFGGTWVYEQTADTVFTRRRVQVDHFVGADSLVVRGIAPDSRIVVTGVSELFGSEFGNFGGEEEEDD